MQSRDSLLVHGVRYIEVQRRYSSTIESGMIVTLVTLPVILLSGQLAKQFFHAGRASWQVVSKIEIFETMNKTSIFVKQSLMDTSQISKKI